MSTKYLSLIVILLLPKFAAATEINFNYLVNIPGGTSFLDLDLIPNQKVDSFQITYLHSPSCTRIPATQLQVKYIGSNAWSNTSYVTGMYQTDSNKEIDLLRVTFVQARYIRQQCQINFVGLLQDASTDTYAGFFEHQGGFVHQIEIPLDDEFVTEKIKFVVPQYCHQLEILKVEIPFGEELVEALGPSTGQNRVYSLPYKMPLDRILVTLNGPEMDCDVPIYVDSEL